MTTAQALWGAASSGTLPCPSTDPKVIATWMPLGSDPTHDFFYDPATQNVNAVCYCRGDRSIICKWEYYGSVSLWSARTANDGNLTTTPFSRDLTAQYRAAKARSEAERRAHYPQPA